MQKIIKMKVKSKTEILKWLKANGYKKEHGDWKKRTYDVDFIPEMFECCGKIGEFSRNIFSTTKSFKTESFEGIYFWRKEWLEAVKTVNKKGRRIETMNQLSAYINANGKIYFGSQVLNSAFVQNFYFHTLDMAVKNSMIYEVVEVVK